MSNQEQEYDIHTKAELWCNKHTSMGCRVQRCLQAFRDDAECRGYKRQFVQCVDEKKNEFRAALSQDNGQKKK